MVHLHHGGVVEVLRVDGLLFVLGSNINDEDPIWLEMFGVGARLNPNPAVAFSTSHETETKGIAAHCTFWR